MISGVRLFSSLVSVLLFVGVACAVKDRSEYAFGEGDAGGGGFAGGVNSAGVPGAARGGRSSGSAGGGGSTAGGGATGGSFGTFAAGAGGTSDGDPCVTGLCAGECTPGVSQCNGLQPQVCDLNGNWQDLGAACPVLCDGGSCTACSPDAKQCNALQPQICNTSGVWENTGAPCDFVCDGSTGACIGECTPLAKQCEGLQPQVCDEQGTWEDLGTACPSVCNGGTCTACEPDTKQCNGLQTQVCSASGKWEDEGTPCLFLCDQTTASCTGDCSPGAKQCDELQPQVCDATGTWKDTGAICEYVCTDSSGTCGGACTPGAKQCAASQPQVCDENGAWKDSGSACGTCNPCSASTGTCVIAGGANCDDNNKCTNGEKCQSNGSCGGGTTVTCTGADQCHTVAACLPASGCPAPVAKSGSCDDGNACKVGEMCTNGSCGGGNNVAQNTPCGTNNGKYCDGSGTCQCRTKSSWNLLENPGFNNGAAGWILNSPAAYNSSVDAESCSGSGSIQLSALSATFRQCVPASPGQTYFFGFRFKANGSSTASGTATCDISFLPAGSTCQNGVATSGVVAYGQYTGNSWILVSATGESDSDTTQISFNCSAPASNGFYDQLYLSDDNPGSPPF